MVPSRFLDAWGREAAEFRWMPAELFDVKVGPRASADRMPQAMNNLTPMAVWRAGMDKIEAAARAVDMPLRLDNANALPTYPQQKQKQQEAA